MKDAPIPPTPEAWAIDETQLRRSGQVSVGPPDVAPSPFVGAQKKTSFSLHQNDIIMTNLRMTFMTLRDDDMGIYGYA